MALANCSRTETGIISLCPRAEGNIVTFSIELFGKLSHTLNDIVALSIILQIAIRKIHNIWINCSALWSPFVSAKYVRYNIDIRTGF